MKSNYWSLPVLVAALSWPHSTMAKVTRTVTFAEFPPGTLVSNQVPGVVFRGLGALLVQSPPPLANAQEPSLSAIGSPGFRSLNLLGLTSYSPFYLVGYDAKGNEIARSATPVLVSTSTREEVAAFMPVLAELQSVVPMSFITLDWDEEFTHNYGLLLFDDLTFTRAAIKVKVSTDLSDGHWSAPDWP